MINCTCSRDPIGVGRSHNPNCEEHGYTGFCRTDIEVQVYISAFATCSAMCSDRGYINSANTAQTVAREAVENWRKLHPNGTKP